MLDKTELEISSHLILQRIIAVFRRLYGEWDTLEHRLITCNILRQLISRFDHKTIEGANLHAHFCSVFVGILRRREFAYDKVECNFNFWNLAGVSVSLWEDRLFLIFPASKTYRFCQRVIHTILAIPDKDYAIKSLCNLFEQFLQPHHHLLFSHLEETFDRNYVTNKFQVVICVLGYKRNYTSHSFQRGAAISARLAWLSEEKIQFLGRWNSNFNRLYIELISTGWIMRLADTNSLRGHSLHWHPFHRLPLQFENS